MSNPRDTPCLHPRPYPQRPPGKPAYPKTVILVLGESLEQARALASSASELGCGTLVPQPGKQLESIAGGAYDIVLSQSSNLTSPVQDRLRQLGCGQWLSCGPAPSGSVPHAVLPVCPTPHELHHAVGQALERQQLECENKALREALHPQSGLGRFSSRDAATGQAIQTACTVADTKANVLLQGESGTGKTLLAQAIHNASARSSQPLITVNCGALPANLLESELFGHKRGAFSGAHQDRPGRIVAAQGGTLFLDEINSAPLDLQVKLLRVLQDRKLTPVGGDREIEVDVRWITATNQDLPAEIEAKRFREDLYYRIHVVSITLPPLRERMADLTRLAESFLQRFSAEYEKRLVGIHPECMALLAGYHWPGNIRQLENAIERGALMATGTELLPEHLGNEILQAVGWHSQNPHPESLLAGLSHLQTLPTLRDALEEPEKAILNRALELCSGNRNEAAAMLDINRSTLFNKMRKYDLLSQLYA